MEEGHHKLYVLGIVGQQYFRKKDVDMDEQFHYTVQKPTMHRARVIAREVVEKFLEGDLDEVDIIYTEMENAVTMETKRVQLLPLKKGELSYTAGWWTYQQEDHSYDSINERGSGSGHTELHSQEYIRMSGRILCQ